MAIRTVRHIGLPYHSLVERASLGPAAVTHRVKSLVARELLRDGSTRGSLVVSTVAPLDGSADDNELQIVREGMTATPAFFGMTGPPPIVVEPLLNQYSVDADIIEPLPHEGAAMINLMQTPVRVQLAENQIQLGAMSTDDIPDDDEKFSLVDLLRPLLGHLHRRTPANPTVLILYPVPVAVPFGDEGYHAELERSLQDVFRALATAIPQVWPPGRDLSYGVLPAYIEPVEDDED